MKEVGLNLPNEDEDKSSDIKLLKEYNVRITLLTSFYYLILLFLVIKISAFLLTSQKN